MDFFGGEFPYLFGNFSKAMLTMLQIMTFDSWCSGITRMIVLSDTENLVTPVFFVTYILISGLIMANVVLAILLDKFLEASKLFEEELKARQEQEQEEKRVLGFSLLFPLAHPCLFRMPFGRRGICP